MNSTSKRMGGVLSLALVIAFVMASIPVPNSEAADHGDAPVASLDRGVEITDFYLFLDPNDNSKVILGFGVHGFIPPGENNNFSPFDPNVRYRFEIDTTGDAIPEQAINVTFSPRTAAGGSQMATIILPFGEIITAPTTGSSATSGTAPASVITTDPATGVSFFAGLVDDPFFFDVPAEILYRNSRVASPPDGSGINPGVFSRARDTFAGYNVNQIVLSIPISYFKILSSAGNPTANSIGAAVYTQRQRRLVTSRDGVLTGTGGFANVDRMGVPGVNTVFLPFARRDEYNRANSQDDANLRFANDIITSLTNLKTGAAGINTLANLVVFRGDMLRLSFAVANSGPGGGNNAGAGFPNGRRPADDVIDTVVTIINNFQPVGGAGPGTNVVDNVNANDVPFRNTFPFFSLPNQIFPAGTVDDRTRN